jgi:hypothetical protein
MATRKNFSCYELGLDDLRELTSLLNIRVQGDKRKRVSYLIALNKFLAIRTNSKTLEGLFELEVEHTSTDLPAVYKALEF